MTRTLDILRSFARAGILLGLLAVPFAAVSVVNAGNKVTIEQPAPTNNGVGLVLLVSLQRA